MLAQQLVDGVLLGACYAVFAAGFTLMFGALRVVNLTYGFYVSAGAFAALVLTRDAGLGIWAALPLAALAAGALAMLLDGLLLTRLRRTRAPELASPMVTLGGVLALYAVAGARPEAELRGPPPGPPPGLLGGTAFELAGLQVGTAQLFSLLACLLLVGALVGLLRATRPGLAIRAMAEHPEAAALLGIDTGRTARLVSFVAGCLAGASGVLIGLNFNIIHPTIGEPMMVRGFVVVIAGGLGSITGALLAGLGLGVVEAFTPGDAASGLKEAMVFAILLAVLWTHPAGLFGRLAQRRA